MKAGGLGVIFVYLILFENVTVLTAGCTYGEVAVEVCQVVGVRASSLK